MDKAFREHFHHASHIGVRGFGATVEEAFEQAASALTAAIRAPASVQPEREVVIQRSVPTPNSCSLTG